jgi:hypothetical protein
LRRLRLAPFLEACQLLAPHRLHREDLLDGVGVDAVDHLLEHLEPLLLVLLERVLLRVAAQADALLQMVHVEEVFLPELVDRLEENELLHLPHHRRREARLALGQRGAGRLAQGLLEVLPRHGLARLVGDLQADVVLGEDGLLDRRPIPLVRRRVAGHLQIDQRPGDAVGHLQDLLGEGLAAEHVAALVVDHLALRVHHVVVLEEMLADVEVVRLDLLLGIGDGARDQAMLDRLALFHPEAGHQALDALGAEDAQQVILERQVEPRRAGIALAAGATAQLVVDAPALVPLRAEDEETAASTTCAARPRTARDTSAVHRCTCRAARPGPHPSARGHRR